MYKNGTNINRQEYGTVFKPILKTVPNRRRKFIKKRNITWNDYGPRNFFNPQYLSFCGTLKWNASTYSTRKTLTAPKGQYMSARQQRLFNFLVRTSEAFSPIRNTPFSVPLTDRYVHSVHQIGNSTMIHGKYFIEWTKKKNGRFCAEKRKSTDSGIAINGGEKKKELQWRIAMF